MNRPFSNSASNNKPRNTGSTGDFTASNKSVSAPVPPGKVAFIADEAVSFSGTARARRRLKRENKVVKESADNLPAPAADMVHTQTADLSNVPAAGPVDTECYRVTLGESYFIKLRDEVGVQQVQGNTCSERQILEHALEYYFAVKYFITSEHGDNA